MLAARCHWIGAVGELTKLGAFKPEKSMAKIIAAPKVERGLADIGKLGALWESHCKAAAAREEGLRGIQAATANANFFNGGDHGCLAERWRSLGASDLAQALFAMDLSDGERALALSHSHPLRVESMLNPGPGKVADRQIARIEAFGEFMRTIALFGSVGAQRAFPSDEPFGGHGASALAAQMRPRRVAHVAALFGSIGAMGAGALGASLVASASAHPYFQALAMGSCSIMAISSAMATLGRSPEIFSVAKIASLAWPGLSSKRAFKCAVGELHGSESARAELAIHAREQSPVEVDGLGRINSGKQSGDPFKLPSSQWHPSTMEWVRPYLAAKERLALDASAEKACSERGSRARSL